jgi:hypothetical protein
MKLYYKLECCNEVLQMFWSLNILCHDYLPGYGIRNQDESPIILSLKSVLAGCSSGRYPVRVSMPHSPHIKMMVSNTWKHRSTCCRNVALFWALKFSGNFHVKDAVFWDKPSNGDSGEVIRKLGLAPLCAPKTNCAYHVNKHD